MEAHLDVCITRCPHCNFHHAEASWYAVELESDLECGKCGKSFNAGKNISDRLLIEFSLKDGKVANVKRASKES